MIIEGIFMLMYLPLIEQTIYLLNSEDSSSTQFYDCLIQNNIRYCRRPNHPINLERNKKIWNCYHNGTKHSFNNLERNNISATTVLREWKSSVEMAEEYAYYLQRQKVAVNGYDKFICQCINSRSFGKYCEYQLTKGVTFEEEIEWQLTIKKSNPLEMHLYGDILCYRTLQCNSGLLCLDWRDICDGVQHCMFGYDEENCDKLEFNECEDDEYRCTNGMCIPDQYFLDGDYDCMDMSDEKGNFNDVNCTFRDITHECDDRICFHRQWSCGDGQCIEGRTRFQGFMFAVECVSLRDQYYMCETHKTRRQWTLPNGRCFPSLTYNEIQQNHSVLSECLYLLKCALSKGAEKNCPCGFQVPCTDQLMQQCNSTMIQYPTGSILAPYAFIFYNITRHWNIKIPDLIIGNGTIKCRGYMADRFLTIVPGWIDNSITEFVICLAASSSFEKNDGYDRFCYKDSRTFNNRSYYFIDVCQQSKDCISAYRINDGSVTCAFGGHVVWNDIPSNSCVNIQRYRLRCSKEEPLCLSVNLIGNEMKNCKNGYDEQWMGKGKQFSNLLCDKQLKHDCQIIRQYIEESSKTYTELDYPSRSVIFDRIPFRWFCDTFWQLDSRKDEDVRMCQKYWQCEENQWQCHTGQCINPEWVLDGEWDCSDASDEIAIFVTQNAFSVRNLKLRNEIVLRNYFNRWYKTQPFSDICNLSIEYPCYRVNASDPLNFTEHRPCINLTQIGDNHVDCVGALDERNNRLRCNRSSMLGYYFECSDGNQCEPYKSHCLSRCKDSRVQCHGFNKSSDCSSSTDFMCFNGTCIKGGRCNRKFECSHGEDEYLCILSSSVVSVGDLTSYRKSKTPSLEDKHMVLDLPPIVSNTETQITAVNSTHLSTYSINNQYQSENYPVSVPFWCNRGIGIQLFNQSIVCFCPPQYYGNKCQYHSDRLTVLIHLNLSQSIYEESTNPMTLLKLMIILLYENETVMIESCHVRPYTKTTLIKKTIHYLLYSRSNDSLAMKQIRYFNRSMINNHHPYSVRIEAYEIEMNAKPLLVAVWLYPIYFDFLPNYRLAQVLHLITFDNSFDPCFNNPCGNHQECYRLHNDPSRAICLCQTNFSGKTCSIEDRMCQDDYCGSNSLCKPNYRGLVNGNNRVPYCLCPLNRLGDRCQFNYDLCDKNPCLNNGTCLSTLELNSYFCLCGQEYYGNECQLRKNAVHLRIDKHVDDRLTLVQYFDISYHTFDLILVYQHLYDSLPENFVYLHKQATKAPAVIIVKLYSTIKVDIYCISLQINVESIRGITEVSKKNHCPNINMLLTNQTEISPIQYHHVCLQNERLLCFLDKWYLCVCTMNQSRAQCFGYDYSLDRCSQCFSGGRCVRGDLSESERTHFRCLCPRCFSGRRCQFSVQQMSFTLDSLIGEDSRSIQLIFFIFSVFMFSVGAITNYACLITFLRVTPRKFGVGYYLLILSVSNQFSLLSLLLKMSNIALHFSINAISCKAFSFILSFTTRYTYWLTNWITLERVSSVLFPFNHSLRKPGPAKFIALVTLIILVIMHVHELLFFNIIQDTTNGQVLCVANYSTSIWSYNFANILVQHLVPFCIQISSTTILIIFIALSASRSTKNHERFFLTLKQKFNRQKELYITSLILVFSALPQIILSSAMSCTVLSAWQRHLLCASYFISYLPQVLGFVLFVLPSTIYWNEFQQAMQSCKIHFLKSTNFTTRSKKTDIN